MNNIISKTIFIALLSVTLIQCNNNTITKTVKLHASDPFKNTIVPSQSFDIDSKQDNVIEGKSGTVVVCPKGCFKNGNGDIVEQNVKIELSEALSLEDMLLSNLTTTSDGKQLETDGMIYFNVTANGEQLSINKENPIHIEIPTKKKKPGMMVYKGIRNEQGNMNWFDPKALDNYLLTVDINSLDFLPQGFQTEVEKGMPYKKYKTATQDLTDSLYYSLSISDQFSMLDGFVGTSYNEPFYNKDNQIVNGKYTSESYNSNNQYQRELNNVKYLSQSTYGVDPSIIKVIKSEKYQNTFIATREFETRLKFIFKICNNAILETYINNLDKNLYEVDSMAAIIAEEDQHKIEFQNFSQQRLTKVKQADKYAKLLKGYYDDQLAKVKSELLKNQEKLMNELKKKNEEAQKVADDYMKLLEKREKFRMETYGFKITETGWINIDKGTLAKDWYSESLEINIANGKEFDRVYSYIIYTSIKSLYRLNTSDNENFYVGNEEDKKMLMPIKKLAVAIAIGYKDEIPSLSIKEFEIGEELNFSLTLTPSSINKVKEAISAFEKYDEENKISIDLEFMAKFYKEEQRQKELVKESEFIMRLWDVAFPCRGAAAAIPIDTVYVSH
jgi:hypothetical protein